MDFSVRSDSSSEHLRLQISQILLFSRYYLNGGDAFRLKLIFTSRRARIPLNKENQLPVCQANENETLAEEEGGF